MALLVKMAGKSTLLNILAGRIPLESGKLVSVKPSELAIIAKRRNGPNQRMIAYLQEAAEEENAVMEAALGSLKC